MFCKTHSEFTMDPAQPVGLWSMQIRINPGPAGPNPGPAGRNPGPAGRRYVLSLQTV